ncbi:MAG: phage tail tape measure protein, partial [Bacteroides sp.]|nr:phage tail tape measure protein [Bacteroides sp.]
MSVNQNAEVSVKVNGEEARRRLQELETIARGFRKEMAKAQEQGNNTEFKRLNQSLKETKREMNKMRRLGYNVNEVMKRLDQSSPNELRNALRSINQQLNSGNIARGSKEWNEYNENARKVRDTLSSIRREQYESESWLSRAGVKFKNFFSSVLVQLGAITGMSWGAQQSIKEYLNLEESYSSLMKYAGMTHDEVKGLNEEFKKIDTRTAREQLNQLGGEAGKLGIKGKEDILEFVEASDLINLALGQDLGAEGVKNIGKLALMFGEDKTLGLKNAMLATGSAINELAQSSTASEPYLAGFAARLGGVGLQANIAQTSILGYGSVLDQNMQSQEIAATSLQTVILKMFETPKLFAQASGKSVDEFTKLLKEDANEALLTFLESLNKMGGLEDLAPLFKELNLGGTRASGVISTLASKVDDIREAQELATSAYQQGNSVVDEANLKNNTAQAILEKKQQALRDEAELLGEVLFPLQTSGLGLLAKLIKTITTVITFSVKHARTLIALAATIASYNVALKINVMWNERKIKTSTTSLALDKLQVVWTKAKTAALWLYVAAKEALAGRTKNAALAMKHFFNLLKINPFALIVSSVVALAGAIYVLSNRLSAAEKAQRSLNKIRGEAQSSIEGEKAQLLSLYKIASDETLAKEKRLNAIKRINEISPEYFGNLDLEKIKTGEAKEAIDDYVKSQIR